MGRVLHPALHDDTIGKLEIAGEEQVRESALTVTRGRLHTFAQEEVCARSDW